MRGQIPEELAGRVHERRAGRDRRRERHGVRVHPLRQIADGFLRRAQHVAAVEERGPGESLARADEERVPGDERPLIAATQAQPEEHRSRDEQEDAIQLRGVELDTPDAPEQPEDEGGVIGP